MIKLLNSTLQINQFRQIHAVILTNRFKLLSLFTQKVLFVPPFIDYARQVFDHISQPNQSLYNSLISACSKLSLNKETIEKFHTMRCKNVSIDCYTVPPVLRSCSCLLDVHLGKQVHCLGIRCGLDSTVYVQTGLIDFYAKVGDIDSAKHVFDGVVFKDPVCYNCLISGYSKSGDVEKARMIFDKMEDKTVVSWNSMLSCYAHNGDYSEVFRIFESMQVEKCRANEYTAAMLLSVCAKLGDLDMGCRVKNFIDENKLCTNIRVSTALLEMFAKCGDVDEARRVFDQMVGRDVVAWSAMIAGYAQNGRSSEALELFEEMKGQWIKPNDVTIVSVLSACAQLGSVEAGKSIGSFVESQCLDSDLRVASALLGMYSKCGNIERARKVFEKMPQKDVVTWNSMIMGLAINGFAEDAIAHYEKMKEIGVKPDDITFVGILTACVHAGLLELGLHFFEMMRVVHEIVPKMEHYACMVDLFCRGGKLKPAYDFICKMKVQPNAVIWGTLLAASKIHLNVELAEICVNKLVELEPENSGNYVLLSNIYASVGRWQEALMVRNLMKGKKLYKTAAYSWIELENRVHKFLVGDTSHSKCEDVYNTAYGLALHSAWNTHEADPHLEL